MNELSTDSRERCLAIVAHHTDSYSSAAVVGRVLEEFGRVEILINNEGESLAIWSMASGVEKFDGDIDLNLKPVARMTFAVSDVVKSQKFGRVINVGILAGRTTNLISGLGYAAAKAGLEALTRYSAAEVAPFARNQ